MNYWGLATFQHFAEELAIENLDRQSHDYYFPRFLEKKIKRGKVIDEPVALFPGYVLVLITERWSSIKHTKGITSVVMAGSFPSMMRTREIEKWKSSEVGGFVVLPERPVRTSAFKTGQSVRATSGAMTEAVGIYQGDKKADRTKVLFKMFGRDVGAYMREQDLEAVA